MNYYRRELTPQLAQLERQAKQGLISQRVYLAAFQYTIYTDRRDILLQQLLPCTQSELKRLGVL